MRNALYLRFIARAQKHHQLTQRSGFLKKVAATAVQLHDIARVRARSCATCARAHAPNGHARDTAAKGEMHQWSGIPVVGTRRQLRLTSSTAQRRPGALLIQAPERLYTLLLARNHRSPKSSKTRGDLHATSEAMQMASSKLQCGRTVCAAISFIRVLIEALRSLCDECRSLELMPFYSSDSPA